MRFYLFVSLYVLITSSLSLAINNTSKIDSLLSILNTVKEEKSIDILNELSSVYLESDPNKSLEYAKKALEISEKYHDDELIAFSKMTIADAYYKMNSLKSAIQFYEQALDYYFDQRSSDYKIYIYTRLGHSEKMLSNYNDALFYYQKPLNLYMAEKDNKISEAYNNIGNVYKLQNNFSEALKYHLKALNASSLALDQTEIANTLKYIGSLYWKNSQYDSSLYYYEKSLDIYRETSDTIGEATILDNIGVLYKDKGEFKKALDYNLKALDLRIKIDAKKEIANSYNNIGNVYLAINDIENALHFYSNSLDIRTSINDILGIAQSQNNIALLYRKINKFDKSLNYFLKSLNNYYKVGNKSLIANSLNQIGYIYKKLNKYDLSLENYLKALRLSQEVGDKNKTASILNNIGVIYDEIDNYSKALDLYSKSLEIKREIGDKKEIAYSLHIIGNTYLKLNNYAKALDFYRESLNLRKEVGDKVSIANSYKSIGNTYLQLNDYSNSIKYLNNAYKLRNEIGDIKGVSDILNDIGNYYNQISNKDLALKYFNEAIELSKKTGDKYLKSLCLRKKGVIQLNNNAEKEGINNIQLSLKEAESINNLELMKNAYYEFYDYYNKIGKKSTALDYYINYTHLKDSIDAKLKSQKLLEIQMNFELQESYNEISRIENEITELTAEKKIRELELKKQKNVRNLLFLIALITFVSGGLIFNQFLSKRKTNLLLQEKIDEVDRSNKLLTKSEDNLKILNATKDKFFSIIAHDLRNPFNALHGLTKHLTDNFDKFTPRELKDSIELVHNSADDLLELLENLLHWSRTQRGKMQFSPREINLHDIISKIFNLLSMNAKKKNINLTNEISKDVKITADYDMITAILRNLVLNAIKFSYNNSFIRVSSEDTKDYTEISVMDNGVGISEDNIKKLFRIDVHHSTSGTSEEQGSGLGLILCHEFVEKHNGQIWVESEINKGSTFKFTIPKKIKR